MPKIFNARHEALASEKGEMLMGLQVLGTHAVYFEYWVFKPGEQNRELCPGFKHEQIVYVTAGPIKFRRDGEEFLLEQGQAFHLRSTDKYWLDNPSGVNAAEICLAGGHTPEGAIHHAAKEPELLKHLRDFMKEHGYL